MSVSNSVPVNTTRGVGRPRVATSAMSRAREILKNAPVDTPRKEVVRQFVSTLGLSRTVAGSYYTILNKKR